jgi:cell division protein FtsI/penicillin-binding protein 2/predicted small secreted protein
MHSMIKKTALAPALLAALAATATACDSAGGTAGKPGATAASPPSASRGLGNIVVGGRAVTGSLPSGNAKVPYRRTYSDGALYAPVTGYRSMAYGWAGLEGVYDDVLTAGVRSGGASGDIVTTIDPGAQKAAFDALGKRPGAAVALDARTGKLLALVSAPSYDPATFSGNTFKDEKAWKALNRDAGRPMLNRALRRPPTAGTAFHVVVAAAALEHGLYPNLDAATRTPLAFVLPGTTEVVAGGSEHCANASLRTALRFSCANVFAKLAADLGQSALRSTAEKLGFNEEVRIPVRADASVYPSDALTGAELARTGNGDGDVTVTPLELARVAAATADGGRLANPRLVERVRWPDGRTEEPKPSTQETRQALSRRTADQLRSPLTDGLGGNSGSAAWFTTCAQRGGRPVSVAVHVEDESSAADNRREAERIAEQTLAALS